MSFKTSKLEPVKGQTSVRCCKTKQDVRPSTKASRLPVLSQKTVRCVESSAREIKTAHREVTKISSSSGDSSKWAWNFILMIEVRRKIIAFRSIADLPPLTTHLSTTSMVMRTMKDLNKLCPEIVESSQIINMRRVEVDKLLDRFYNSLKSIGDSWMDDHEWIIKSKYSSSSLRKNLSDRLVEKVLAALDGLIKGMNERLSLREMSNDERKKTVSPKSKISFNRSESLVKQLRTPRTVLKPPSKVRDFESSVSSLPRNVRMQTLVKLSPIDIKRLANKNLCEKEAQSNDGNRDDNSGKNKKSETERNEKMEKAKESILVEQYRVNNQTDDKSCSKLSKKSEIISELLAPGDSTQSAPALAAGKGLVALSRRVASLSTQPPLSMASRKGPAARPSPPPPGDALQPAQPPLPVAAGKGQVSQPPPPLGAASQPAQLPLAMAAGKGQVARPPPPPPPPPPGAASQSAQPLLLMTGGKGQVTGPLSPPPGSSKLPPPPPPGARGSVGAKKSISKLRRSTQLGSLYRFLKAKLEGKNHEPRSRGACDGSKGRNGSVSANGKQGMADALAEITKRSPYFQKIEEDVKMYMKSINVLKTEISKFQNKDITVLQQFHHYIESVLNKLEDETQVLARCEGFPHNKLEVIRMAAALSSKLQGMIKELKNWKIESPVIQLLDKTERCFAKKDKKQIRREIETLDQIKEEEERKFKSHNIHFDFSILVQIKELMVDISSGCMELALKEKREAKIASQTTAESREDKPSMKNKTACWSKMLWRVFQFAFRVYTFAGGLDDRADKLAKELAEEIELILKKNSDS